VKVKVVVQVTPSAPAGACVLGPALSPALYRPYL